MQLSNPVKQKLKTGWNQFFHLVSPASGVTKAAKDFQQKLTQNNNSTTSTTQKDIKRKKMKAVNIKQGRSVYWGIFTIIVA